MNHEQSRHCSDAIWTVWIGEPNKVVSWPKGRPDIMHDLEGEAGSAESCIQSLMDRTVIIITHRLASLALALQIFALSPAGAGARAAQG